MKTIEELKNTIHCADSLEFMKEIQDGVIDLVLTDPPYGITACPWDKIPNLEKMWKELKRIGKDNCAYVFTARQPFTTDLINSNRKWFKYEWIWFKNVPTGMAQSRYQPMKYHENILVFSNGTTLFNKQLEDREGKGKDCYNYEHYCGDNNHVKMGKVKKFYDVRLVNPSTVLLFNVAPNRKNKLHPTQKPVALGQYLIKTYTNEGDTVFDGFAGSGSFLVAAMLEKRNFIGCELEEKYYDIAVKRIEDAQKEIDSK